MNITIITGRISKEIDLRYTQTGKSVATFNVAVRRPFTKDTVDFITCVAWEKDADHIAKYFNKGDFIEVRGYLTLRPYEITRNDTVEKRTATEIIVREWGFGGGQKKENEKKEEKPEQKPAEEPDYFPLMKDDKDEFMPF